MSRREDPRPVAHSFSSNGHDSLDDLTKAQLLERAERSGLSNAARLTRLELLDELKRRTGLAPRGLLGRARDLLRGVVERGLVKALGVEPETAAATIGAFVDGASGNSARSQAAQASSESSSGSSGSGGAPKSEPVTSSIAGPPAAPLESADTTSPPVATRTLAEIYFAQGHLNRARAVIREVLRVSPLDLEAKALLEKIEALAQGGKSRDAAPVAAATSEFIDDPYAAYSVDAIDPEAFVDPVTPAVTAAPMVPAMLDDEPLPARYDVDECVALSVDAFTVYVYWETRPATVARAQRALAKSGAEPVQAILRVLVVEPTLEGPRVSTRDVDVDDVAIGETFVRSLPAGAVVRVAIGLRAGDRFLPLAHTADLESPPDVPSDVPARKVVVWTRDRREDAAPIDVTANANAASVEAMREALVKVRRERHGDRGIEANDGNPVGEARRVRLGSSEDAWAISPAGRGDAGPNAGARRGGASEMLPRR
ncbi:MAG: DUF4912 domain-containing protein [Polyangiales bacterium]